MKYRLMTLFGLALILSAGGRAAQAGEVYGPGSFVRVLHALSLGTKIDVDVNGKRLYNDVEFGLVTKYIRVPAGYTSLRITTNNPTRTLFATTRTLRPNTFYTVGLYGTPSRKHFLFANDSSGYSAYGRAQLTFYQFSPDTPPFDVVAYLPGGRIMPLIRHVKYGQARRANIPATPMTVRLTRYGQILKTQTGAEPRAGRKYAAYAVGRNSRNFKMLLDVTASQ